MSENTQGIRISIVLPVYNEEGNVEPLYDEIVSALEPLNLRFEILFVDDGSRDQTLKRLLALQEQDERVRVIQFRRNFGQTAAMTAGFDHARGEVIVTLDADRQNDPADIPRLLDELGRGVDMVCGWRYERKDGFWLRRLPSIVANRVISYTTDVKLHDYGCTLKAFRSDVAKNLSLYGEMHRFIPAIASWMGVSITEMKVNHRPRTSGQSKYGISRTLRVILDLLTVKYLLSYSNRPIQLFGTLGLIGGGVGSLILGWVGIQRIFFGIPLGDRPLLLLAILLIFAGLQFITVGLLAEIQTRTYYESQNKPTYTIRAIHQR